MFVTFLSLAFYNAPSLHTVKMTILKTTIDTENKAKRNDMISELITFRTTKAKAKVNFE